MMFSVIVPTFNRAPLLSSTLKSVAAQDFTDFEVVVVDDGSSDNTAEVVRDNGKCVYLALPASVGPGECRNTGARSARGEYLAFLDSDDLWFRWTLNTFAGLILRHNRPALLSAQLVEFEEENTLASTADAPVKADVFKDYFAAHGHGYFVGGGMSVIRRDDFLAVGGYTTKSINGEDHDLALRLGDRPGFVQILSPVTLAWRRHEGSATRNIRQSVEGNKFLISQELANKYPGGARREKARHDIIARHTRALAWNCLKQRRYPEARELYRQTLRWNIRLGRMKFLIGLPLMELYERVSLAAARGGQSSHPEKTQSPASEPLP